MSRGQDVIADFMGDQRAEVWLSDCWKPQLNAPADQHQLCLPHQIRALQGLMDRRPHLRWAREMQALFRTAIHLGHRRDELTPVGFRRQVTGLERRLDRLLERSFTGPGTNLLDRYRTHTCTTVRCVSDAPVCLPISGGCAGRQQRLRACPAAVGHAQRSQGHGQLSLRMGRTSFCRLGDRA